ncbi:MAG: chemotaxis protein CheW [Planctomycetota bacterium]
MDVLDDIFKEFLVESYENLDQLDSDLVALEDTPGDLDCLASIFRTVHTIKGTSGFLALPKLERVTHVGENLLVPLRDGELNLTQNIADGLLAMVDAIREILGHIENDGGEGDGRYDALVQRLEKLLHDGKSGGSTAPDEPARERGLSDEELTDVVAALSESKAKTHDEVPEPTARGRRINATRRKASRSKQKSDVDATVEATEEQPQTTAAVSGLAVSADEGETQDVRTAEPAAQDEPVTGKLATTSIADSTVRIDVNILDRLMNLVGELVLARNQILQYSRASDDATLTATSQRLNLITTELQEGVMKTRMQPIRNAWSKLPRVVRDLSTSCGKKVEVKMEGEDTELDKTILEAIKDPLTHIVRNSVDHGIELPEVRVANGKPAQGTLCLRAFHESGQVNIEIIDDGGGINVDRVRSRAVERGLITPEQAATMSDRDTTNLILLPGFSTAPRVTRVSGRGVGMDVVKTNIERISGSLDILSSPGQGTTLRIRIPLTLAIVPALVVQVCEGQYAIPQVSLLELVRLEADRAQEEVEFMYDAPVYRLRGNLLPLVYLDEQLGLRPKRTRNEHNEKINIVVLQAEDQQFGLVVDSVTDTQEIVVKPLGSQLKGIPAYAGASIMGDGSVALILDVPGIAQGASVLSRNHEPSVHDKQGNELRTDSTTTQEPLLVVDPGDGSSVAVNLSAVARLEEFKPSSIEVSGHSEVVQYRGQIMPLIHLDSSGYSTTQDDDSQRIPVVVFTSRGQSVGIVVGRVVDIVNHTIESGSDSLLPGKHVIQGRVTELIDIEEFVRSTLPELFE